MQALQKYTVGIAAMLILNSVLQQGIGRRRRIPTTIDTRGSCISVTAACTTLTRTLIIVIVVSQAFNRLGEDFSFFSIKRKVFPYDPI